MKETVRPAEGMELDLRKLLGAYLRRWWLILLAAAVVGGGALGYTAKLVTPLYRAGITVYVNNVRSGERIDYISGSNAHS